MDSRALRARLIAAGCSESNYSIGCRNDDTLALEKIGGEWLVFYTERGSVGEVEFRSPIESEACQYLWDRMQTVRHAHLAGASTDWAACEALQARLAAAGIAFWRNDVPAPVVPKTLYRVFVGGTDIFRVRALEAGPDQRR